MRAGVLRAGMAAFICLNNTNWIVGMKIWTLIVNVLLWPGQKAISFFPDMGEEETSLIHNVVNYVVWLALFCGALIWAIIRFSQA